MLKRLILVGSLFVILAGCRIIPGTGDTSSDAAAAQSFVPPEIPGYVSTDATSVSDALTKVGAAGSLFTGNLALAGAIAKLDSMISCYRSVGAVAARVYAEQNITTTTSIPKVGVLAVVNTTRIQRNLMQCVLNTSLSAQSADEIQPCGGSGSKVVNNENLEYVFAATTPELCSIFQAQFN
ncbi:MAG: hypothetical protein R3E39_13535 [Anaerolineae bacterium]